MMEGRWLVRKTNFLFLEWHGFQVLALAAKLRCADRNLEI